MYLVMGITGKVGGATARHLLKQGKQVRALVRDREKAAKWADQGVELVEGDWNDSTAIAAALKGVEGAFVMLPAVWAPSPDYREAKSVIANYVEALTKAVPPRVIALSSMGANRTSGVGMITALSLLEQGFRNLPSPVAFVRAGGFFENFLFGLQAAQGGTLPVFYNPTNRKSTMVASDDIGAEVATLLTGPAWSGHRVIELGSMVSADEVAAQLGEVLTLDVKAFAVPRAGWAEAFEQFGIPKGHTGPAEEMYESVNAGWMDLGVTGTEHVAGTTSARDVFAAAQNAVRALEGAEKGTRFKQVCLIEEDMRGGDDYQDELFTYGGLSERVPAKHPLRRIRELADAGLAKMSSEFEGLYSKIGRPSIPPEQLLRALLLQMLYSVRSERMLVEQAGVQPAVPLVRGSAVARACVGCDQLFEEPGAAARGRGGAVVLRRGGGGGERAWVAGR